MFALTREPLVAESNRGAADRCPPRHSLRHSCALSVIPAQAGIHAVCGGQGHSQCSTAPDHPRRAGSCGGPSGGLRLVARLGGRMDSCLRRNDGRGGCDGTEGAGVRDRAGVKEGAGAADRCPLSVSPVLPPSFLRSSPSFLRPVRHSCALSTIPAPCPSFLRRQESMRSVGVKGTPNVRRRPITRGALGAVVGRRAD